MGSDHVLAIDIGGTKLVAALVTPAGELTGLQRAETNAEVGAEQVLAKALELGRTVAQSEPTGGGGPRAVGLSTNGLTEGDRVTLAPAVPGWSALRIPGALRDAFPEIPTAILNDVKSATLAELRWGALAGVREGLYVNLGTGVAAGIVSGGQLVHGEHGAAGEIGYIAPTPQALPKGSPEEAPLEERIGGRGVASWASAELGRPVTMAELMSAEAGSPEHEIRERLLEEVCFWIANVVVVVDPEVVVLGGGIMRGESTAQGGPTLTDRLHAAIQRVAPFPAEVRPARFGPESSLLGAGAIALDLGTGSGGD